MQKFKDENGKEWEVKFTLATVKRFKLIGLDLLGDPKDEEVKELSVIDKLCMVDNLVPALWECCRDQAEKKGLTEDEFLDGIAGEALGDATRAMVEALIDFYPLGKRQLIRKVMEKSQEMESLMLKQLEEGVELVSKNNFSEFMKSQDLLGLTQKTTPSENCSGCKKEEN